MKKYNNCFSKLIACLLAIMSVFSIFTFSMPVTAASAITSNANIKEGIYVFLNEKTNKCYNQYAGGTYNGCKVTLWEYSRGDKDLWIKLVSYNGGFKLFDDKEYIVLGDVYRGNNTKAKAGMKIDVWKNQASEDKFQIFTFERESNGSYIIRLLSQPELAIGITKNKNGAQLQLVKYNKNDSGQRWFICNTNGKKLSTSEIENSSNAPSTSDLRNIPSNYYKVNATYTIGATKYLKCTISKAWGSMAKGTEFFLKASNHSLVTDQGISQKLKTIQLVNNVRSVYIGTLESMEAATRSVYSVASAWTRNTQLAKFIGVSGGAALKAIAGCTTGTPVAVFDSAVTIFKEAAEPETSLAVTTIVALKAISNDTIYWCNRAQTLLSKSISDYDKAVEAATAISMASGNYAAAMWLGKPIVEDAAEANPWTSTFKNMGCSGKVVCSFSIFRQTKSQAAAI